MRGYWSNIIVTGILGMTIVMPEIAKVSIFMDNDLAHITDDHFKIKLIARLLNQIYVVQPPMLPPRYHSSQTIYTCFLPIHRYKVWLHGKNFYKDVL